MSRSYRKIWDVIPRVYVRSIAGVFFLFFFFCFFHFYIPFIFAFLSIYELGMLRLDQRRKYEFVWEYLRSGLGDLGGTNIGKF